MLTLLPQIREARVMAARRLAVTFWVSTGRYADRDPVGFERWKAALLKERAS